MRTLDGLGRIVLPLLDDVLEEARMALLDVHEALADLHVFVKAWRELLEQG